MRAYSYINTQPALDAFVASFSASTVFLDTEFIKRNTYYPILGLVQINVGNTANHTNGDVNDTTNNDNNAHNHDASNYDIEWDVNNHNATDASYLIDAVKLDLTQFWQALLSADLLVMHACSEDIDLIRLEAGTEKLPPIFDTQIGLSFLGYGLQISYQDALAKLLDIQIDKGESCSDWLARPLRKEQLHYAANDVLYLPALYHKVQAALLANSTALNLYDCAYEDSQSLCTEVLYQPSDDEIYLDWADFRYHAKQLAQLQNLCRWREQVARSQNIPRTFVLKKSSLKDIIYQQPQSKKDLYDIKELRAANIKKYAENILACLHELPDEQHYPKRVARPFKEPKDMGLNQQLKQMIATVAASTGIPADVLMRKRWLTKLYKLVAFYGDESSVAALPYKNQLTAYVTGWRYEMITTPLLALLLEHYTLLHSQIVPKEQQLPSMLGAANNA